MYCHHRAKKTLGSDAHTKDCQLDFSQHDVRTSFQWVKCMISDFIISAHIFLHRCIIRFQQWSFPTWWQQPYRGTLPPLLSSTQAVQISDPYSRSLTVHQPAPQPSATASHFILLRRVPPKFIQYALLEQSIFVFQLGRLVSFVHCIVHSLLV